jgi:hypothetical protein
MWNLECSSHLTLHNSGFRSNQFPKRSNDDPLGIKMDPFEINRGLKIQCQALFSGQKERDYPVTARFPQIPNDIAIQCFVSWPEVADSGNVAHRSSCLCVLEQGGFWDGHIPLHPHNMSLTVFSGEVMVWCWPLQCAHDKLKQGILLSQLLSLCNPVELINGGVTRPKAFVISKKHRLNLRAGSYFVVVGVQDCVFECSLWDDLLDRSHFNNVVGRLRFLGYNTQG